MDNWFWPQYWFAFWYTLAFASSIILLLFSQDPGKRIQATITVVLMTIGIIGLNSAGFW